VSDHVKKESKIPVRIMRQPPRRVEGYRAVEGPDKGIPEGFAGIKKMAVDAHPSSIFLEARPCNR
jgi:hypothetical protein